MTINIGLTYDNGVLLLADGRVSEGLKIESENYFKLAKICNNASATIAGTPVNSRYLENLAVSVETCKKYFHEMRENLRKENTKNAKLLLNRADIRITPDMGPEDPPENMTLEEVLTNLKGEEIFAANVFRIYKDKNETFFNVKSAAEQFCNFTDEEVGGIVGGIDLKGPRIFEIEEGKSCIEQDRWSTIGTGFTLVETYLRDHYKNNFTFDQSLELAIFCGVKAAINYTTVNTNFDIVNIYEKNRKIISQCNRQNKGLQKKVDKITKFYSNKKGSFEPISK